MKGMKSFRGTRWTLQCYWPQVFVGGLGSYGIRASTGVIFSRYADRGWAAGFEVLGLGLGLAYTPAPGVRASPNDQQEKPR
jgi:hypothetical protein